MEENIPTFNNKIIGILVPICAQFGGGSGEGETHLNPGQVMYKLDLSDTSRVYELDNSQSEYGMVLYMHASYTEENSESYTPIVYGDWVDVDGNHLIGYLYNETIQTNIPFYIEGQLDTYVQTTVTIQYNEEGESWEINGENEGGSSLMVAGYGADNVDIYSSVNYSDVGIEDTKWAYFSQDYQDELWVDDAPYNISTYTRWSFDNFNSDVYCYSDKSLSQSSYGGQLYVDGEEIDPLPSDFKSPIFKIENGKIIMENKKVTFTYDGEEYEFGNVPVFAVISHTVTTGGGDTGITGTLIQLIPVFVAIALLGAIVTMFLNKREI